MNGTKEKRKESYALYGGVRVMDSREAKELVSRQMRANNRRYYFDVKENDRGVRYLTISETQPGNNDFRRVRLMVFEDHFEGFFKILKELKREMVISQKRVKERHIKK